MRAKAIPINSERSVEPTAKPITNTFVIDGQIIPAAKAVPGLHLVATPIGNLEDITLRALRILKEVDLIACEDTRHTRKLLTHYDIHKPLISYHQHNENARSDELIEALRKGGRIAVVSDAGMPGIADPGATIARFRANAARSAAPEFIDLVAAGLRLAGLPEE